MCNHGFLQSAVICCSTEKLLFLLKVWLKCTINYFLKFFMMFKIITFRLIILCTFQFGHCIIDYITFLEIKYYFRTTDCITKLQTLRYKQFWVYLARTIFDCQSCKCLFISVQRIKEFLHKMITSSVPTQLQIPAGLTAFTKELSALAARYHRLVSHNRNVFGEYYTDILASAPP